jgi:hypothetical protein
LSPTLALIVPEMVKSLNDTGFLQTLRLTPAGPNPYISEAEKPSLFPGPDRLVGRIGVVCPTKAAQKNQKSRKRFRGGAFQYD